MKQLIVIAAVMLFATLLHAQTNQPVAPQGFGSKIEFAQKYHDFGTIEEGIKASYDFEFTNTGDSNLLLLSVQANCGCTVPSWPRQPIKPGEKGKISVVFNSANRAGENFHKSITVITNMKMDHVHIIYIKGQVARKSEGNPPEQPVKNQ